MSLSTLARLERPYHMTLCYEFVLSARSSLRASAARVPVRCLTALIATSVSDLTRPKPRWASRRTKVLRLFLGAGVCNDIARGEVMTSRHCNGSVKIISVYRLGVTARARAAYAWNLWACVVTCFREACVCAYCCCLHVVTRSLACARRVSCSS